MFTLHMNDLDKSLSFLKSETGKALAREVFKLLNEQERHIVNDQPFSIDEDRDVRWIDSKLANGMEWDGALMTVFMGDLCYALEFDYEGYLDGKRDDAERMRDFAESESDLIDADMEFDTVEDIERLLAFIKYNLWTKETMNKIINKVRVNGIMKNERRQEHDI